MVLLSRNRFENLKFYKQREKKDCGPTCLRIVCAHYGRSYSAQYLNNLTELNRDGVSLLSIAEAAEHVGFDTEGVKLTIDQLKNVQLPCIAHWEQQHFVVVYKVTERYVYVADPGHGKLKHTHEQFIRAWTSMPAASTITKGNALLLTPAADFHEKEGPAENTRHLGYFIKLLVPYKGLLIGLAFTFLIATLLQVVLPVITQSIVDVGINAKDIHFIYLLLLGQVMLLIGRMTVDFLRSWIMLHISTRINITILTDFLSKLMRLPISFFDIKNAGDIIQRMGDQRRIESFLTGQTLTISISILNLIIFSFVLAFYNAQIFLWLMAGNILYTCWIIAFLGKRKELDYVRFKISSDNQNEVMQLVQGMQEIKLNGAETTRKKKWEMLQVDVFNNSIKTLSVNQFQQAGSFFINEGKNIVIIYLAAKSVITGELTIGSMMAVQFIVGQLNSPVTQMLQFIQSYQDAKISIDRLNEIQDIPDEEPTDATFYDIPSASKSISLQQLSFKYPGIGSKNVLEGIDLNIPQGQTTAIVGLSGGGKTTLLKILLGFYTNYQGGVMIGGIELKKIRPSKWRTVCGSVLQDGFIFSDTIENNIAIGEDNVDKERLEEAIRLSNLSDYLEGLPLGLQARLGSLGTSLSQGQKQRLLIARAFYKNPDYLFLDEATNALDSYNEKTIIENIKQSLIGKTIVVVAHRLSTVRHADKIVVLNGGKIVEQGSHEELLNMNGHYFKLVSDQLDLKR